LLGAGEMVGVVEVGTEEGEVDRRLSPLLLLLLLSGEFELLQRESGL